MTMKFDGVFYDMDDGGPRVGRETYLDPDDVVAAEGAAFKNGFEYVNLHLRTGTILRVVGKVDAVRARLTAGANLFKSRAAVADVIVAAREAVDRARKMYPDASSFPGDLEAALTALDKARATPGVGDRQGRAGDPPDEPCPFCAYPFNMHVFGRNGCPKCNGKGLE